MFEKLAIMKLKSLNKMNIYNYLGYGICWLGFMTEIILKTHSLSVIATLFGLIIIIIEVLEDIFNNGNVFILPVSTRKNIVTSIIAPIVLAVGIICAVEMLLGLIVKMNVFSISARYEFTPIISGIVDGLTPIIGILLLFFAGSLAAVVLALLRKSESKMRTIPRELLAGGISASISMAIFMGNKMILDNYLGSSSMVLMFLGINSILLIGISAGLINFAAKTIDNYCDIGV